MSYALCTISVTNNAAAAGAEGNPAVGTVSAGVTIQAVSAVLAGVPVGSTASLSIEDIGTQDLATLAQLIQEQLSKLTHLSMRFSPFYHAPADNGLYLHSLAALWKAFTQAPELRSLVLLAGQEIAYQIPFSFLNGTPPPHLVAIDIQGFQMEEPCPALADVDQVRVDLGVVAGVDVSSLGELFPGANRIHIVGLESILLDEDGNPAAVPLSYLHRAPKVTAAHPVPRLILEWAPTVSPSSRPADANWVLESAPFVGELDIICPDHEDVHLRALDALAPRATKLALMSMASAHACTVVVLSGQGQLVRFVIPDTAVIAYLAYLCSLPFPLPVTTLSVAASRLHVLVCPVLPPAAFPLLREIEIDMDLPIYYGMYLPPLLGPLPRFDHVQTLAILGPAAAVAQLKSDPTIGLAELKEALAPNAQLL